MSSPSPLLHPIRERTNSPVTIKISKSSKPNTNVVEEDSGGKRYTRGRSEEDPANHDQGLLHTSLQGKAEERFFSFYSPAPSESSNDDMKNASTVLTAHTPQQSPSSQVLSRPNTPLSDRPTHKSIFATDVLHLPYTAAAVSTPSSPVSLVEKNALALDSAPRVNTPLTLSAFLNSSIAAPRPYDTDPGSKIPPLRLGRVDFLRDLFLFLESKGHVIQKIPSLGYRDLDLYHLYRVVVAKDGMDEVSKKQEWKQIYQELRIPTMSTSASYNTRTNYKKYLYLYELEHNDIKPRVSSPLPFKFGIGRFVRIESSTFKGTTFYAKIIKQRFEGDRNMYYVHYNGWSNSHDEWMPEHVLSELDAGEQAKDPTSLENPPASRSSKSNYIVGIEEQQFPGERWRGRTPAIIKKGFVPSIGRRPTQDGKNQPSSFFEAEDTTVLCIDENDDLAGTEAVRTAHPDKGTRLSSSLVGKAGRRSRDSPSVIKTGPQPHRKVRLVFDSGGGGAVSNGSGTKRQLRRASAQSTKAMPSFGQEYCGHVLEEDVHGAFNSERPDVNLRRHAMEVGSTTPASVDDEYTLEPKVEEDASLPWSDHRLRKHSKPAVRKYHIHAQPKLPFLYNPSMFDSASPSLVMRTAEDVAKEVRISATGTATSPVITSAEYVPLALPLCAFEARSPSVLRKEELDPRSLPEIRKDIERLEKMLYTLVQDKRGSST